MPAPHPMINVEIDGKIICVRCGQWKAPEEFSPAKRMKRGRHSWCTDCHVAWDRERRASDPGYRQRKNERRRESGRVNRRRRLEEEPDFEKWARIRYLYGISKEQFEEMFDRQGGVCANPRCDRPATHIDHDHSCCPSNTKGCGRCVRGLLCKGCNWALGHLGDDSERLLGLAEYLQ